MIQGLIAQPNLEWERSFGGTENDYAESVIQLADGSYIIAGSSNSKDGDIVDNKGEVDAWIIKLDQSGDLLWKNSYGGSKDDIAYTIIQTMDNGFIIAGSSESSDGDVGFNNGMSDFWIFKIDSIGNLMWERSFGGSNFEYATSIDETTENEFVVAGYSLSNDGDVGSNNGSYDYWVIKIDEVGNLIWKKTFGDSETNIATSVQQTKDGGFIIAGNSDGAYDNGFWCWSAILLIKTDSAGEIEWQNIDCVGDFAKVSELKQTSDDGYILVGEQAGDINDPTNSLIIKRDRNGNHEWTKTYYGGGYNSNVGRSIVESKFDNSYSIAGSFTTDDYSSEFSILNYNLEGELNWRGSYDAQFKGRSNSIQQTKDGGYVITGDTYSSSSSGGGLGKFDYFIIKLGSIQYEVEYICQGDSIFLAGEFQSESGIYTDSTSTDIVIQTELIVNNIYETFSDDLYVCHGEEIEFAEQIITEPGSYTFDLVSDAGCDSIVHVNVEFIDEVFIDADIQNDTGSGNGSISLFLVGEVDIIEIIWSTGDIDVTIIENLAPGEYSVEVIDAYGCLTTGIFIIEIETSLDNIADREINIYPNPFTNSITVDVTKGNEIRVEVFNTLGQKEILKILSSDKNVIDTNKLMAGIYFLKMYDDISGAELGSTKLVKE